MKFTKLFTALVLGSLLACQKPSDVITPNNPSDTTVTVPTTTPVSTQGVVYDKGTHIGQPVQKVIGPEGGTLSSADGTLNMTIPAGAVTKATTFTMQPVTPTLPGLIGGQSFRLLPEGQTFVQPVKLQYRYNADSLNGTSPQLLFMAYQGSDGYWKALPGTELDEATHTLTVSTKHFSDWGAFAEFNLVATPDVVFPGESAAVKLIGYEAFVASLFENGPQDEVTLTRQSVLTNPANIKNWKVIGKGSLKVDASQVLATYTAPTSLKQGSDLVTVDVYNFLPTNQQPRKGSNGKAVIMTEIRVEDTYFRATVDGKKYDCKVFQGFNLISDGEVQIMGNLTETTPLSITIYKPALKLDIIDFTNEEPDDIDGKADLHSIDLSDPQNTDYLSFYRTCDGDPIASSGQVTIREILNVKGKQYVTGGCVGTIYHYKSKCQYSQKFVNIEFRLPITTID